MKKLFLLSILMLLPMLANADAVEIDGIYYNLIEKAGQAEVTSNPKKYTNNVVIPETVIYMKKSYNVTSIDGSAFCNCSSLISVSIPNSVTSIIDNAFDGCSSLTSVTIPNSVTSIGDNAFWNCYSLTSVTIPNSVTTIGGCAFRGSGLISMILPNNVTSIGYGTFMECSSLTSVTIPNSVTSIDYRAFYNCSSLTSINIPNSVTDIAQEAFLGCSSLISVTIPNSITSIHYGTFMGCNSLTSLAIPNSVTSIGSWAFSGYSGSSITIPNSVTGIGEIAFGFCKELTDVYCLSESVPSTSSDAFKGSYIEYATLHVPASSVNAYKAAIPWKNFKSIVALDGETPETKKCATPIISYQFGQLSFSCETEGASFVTDITDADIKKHYDASISLTATYNISVYATKDGYDLSDVATATLCWIDVDPKTEGLTNNVAQIRAKPVLIQSSGSMLSITGAEEGTSISVYDVSGKMVGYATASSENTNISTSLSSGDIGLVKIGKKTVKVVMK